MTPFYTLNDFRNSYSHLGSAEGAAEKMKSVTDRLGLAEDAAVTDIYDRLLERMTQSYSTLTQLVTGALPAEAETDVGDAIIDD